MSVDLNLQKDSFVGEKEEAGYSAIYYVHLRVIRFGVKHVRLKTAGVFSWDVTPFFYNGNANSSQLRRKTIDILSFVLEYLSQVLCGVKTKERELWLIYDFETNQCACSQVIFVEMTALVNVLNFEIMTQRELAVYIWLKNLMFNSWLKSMVCSRKSDQRFV